MIHRRISKRCIHCFLSGFDLRKHACAFLRMVQRDCLFSIDSHSLFILPHLPLATQPEEVSLPAQLGQALLQFCIPCGVSPDFCDLVGLTTKYLPTRFVEEGHFKRAGWVDHLHSITDVSVGRSFTRVACCTLPGVAILRDLLIARSHL